MPNKRKTRQLATQHRPKPTLPDGDEDKEMELEDRQKKLNVTIADFDNEGRGIRFLSILRVHGGSMLKQMLFYV